MKNWMIAALILFTSSIMFACGTLVPEHPTKLKSDFYKDQQDCELQAQQFPYQRHYDEFDNTNDMHLIRHCMETKGWEYRKYIKKKK